MYLYCFDEEYANFLLECGFPLIKDEYDSKGLHVFIFSNRWEFLTHPKDKVMVSNAMTF